MGASKEPGGISERFCGVIFGTVSGNRSRRMSVVAPITWLNLEMQAVADGKEGLREWAPCNSYCSFGVSL